MGLRYYPLCSAVEARLELLAPSCQDKARTFLHIVTDDLKLAVKVTETLRSQERQATLLSAGLSQVKTGWHQVGLALDFACFDDKGNYVKDGSDRRYKQCGLIAEALGFVWGGRWEKPDYDHIEYHPGFTLQQYLDAQAKGHSA